MTVAVTDRVSILLFSRIAVRPLPELQVNISIYPDNGNESQIEDRVGDSRNSKKNQRCYNKHESVQVYA